MGKEEKEEEEEGKGEEKEKKEEEEGERASVHLSLRALPLGRLATHLESGKIRQIENR